jgi:hypothetical protein
MELYFPQRIHRTGFRKILWPSTPLQPVPVRSSTSLKASRSSNPLSITTGPAAHGSRFPAHPDDRRRQRQGLVVDIFLLRDRKTKRSASRCPTSTPPTGPSVPQSRAGLERKTTSFQLDTTVGGRDAAGEKPRRQHRRRARPLRKPRPVSKVPGAT